MSNPPHPFVQGSNSEYERTTTTRISQKREAYNNWMSVAYEHERIVRESKRLRPEVQDMTPASHQTSSLHQQFHPSAGSSSGIIRGNSSITEYRTLPQDASSSSAGTNTNNTQQFDHLNQLSENQEILHLYSRLLKYDLLFDFWILSACQGCNTAYTCPRDASRCLRSHGLNRCWKCSRTFPIRPNAFANHNKIVHRMRLHQVSTKCPICGKTCTVDIQFRRHIEEVHFNLEPWRRSKADDELPSWHMKFHEKPYLYLFPSGPSISYGQQLSQLLIPSPFPVGPEGNFTFDFNVFTGSELFQDNGPHRIFFSDADLAFIQYVVNSVADSNGIQRINFKRPDNQQPLKLRLARLCHPTAKSPEDAIWCIMNPHSGASNAQGSNRSASNTIQSLPPQGNNESGRGVHEMQAQCRNRSRDFIPPPAATITSGSFDAGESSRSYQLRIPSPGSLATNNCDTVSSTPDTVIYDGTPETVTGSLGSSPALHIRDDKDTANIDAAGGIIGSNASAENTAAEIQNVEGTTTASAPIPIIQNEGVTASTRIPIIHNEGVTASTPIPIIQNVDRVIASKRTPIIQNVEGATTASAPFPIIQDEEEKKDAAINEDSDDDIQFIAEVKGDFFRNKVSVICYATNEPSCITSNRLQMAEDEETLEEEEEEIIRFPPHHVEASEIITSLIQQHPE